MARNVVPLPPGPNTPSAWQLLRYSRSPLAFLEGCAHRYGDDRAVTPISSRVGSPNNSRTSVRQTRASDSKGEKNNELGSARSSRAWAVRACALILHRSNSRSAGGVMLQVTLRSPSAVILGAAVIEASGCIRRLRF